MALRRDRVKGRREKGPFIAVPRSILDSEEYAELSGSAVKLLIDLLAQFRGSNNGDLTAAWRILKRRGWKSKDTIYRALCELKDLGFLMVTRRGGRRTPTLYAVTFLAIDECDGKLDVKPTSTPPGHWRKNSLARFPGHISPVSGPMEAQKSAA